MRNIFFALLAINVVFFGWAGWIDRPHDAATASAAVPSLELAPVPTAPPSPSTHCRSIGPFADEAAASGNVDVLKAHGVPSRERTAESSVPDGYWVYVDDLKDVDARRKMLAALSVAGIHDAAAMPDDSDRVSVGIFSDQRHAVHRAEQVQELGFKPTMSVHQRSVSTIWLDIDLKPGDPDPTPLQPTTPASRNAPAEIVKVTDCPSKPAGN